MADPLALVLSAIVSGQKPSFTTHQSTTAPVLQHDDSRLRDLMYGMQAYDTINTFSKPVLNEQDPLLRPFSHGGIPVMLGAFALEDFIKDKLLQHTSAGTQNNADLTQILLNTIGVINSNHAQP